jgi:hypothetical protein
MFSVQKLFSILDCEIHHDLSPPIRFKFSWLLFFVNVIDDYYGFLEIQAQYDWECQTRKHNFLHEIIICVKQILGIREVETLYTPFPVPLSIYKHYLNI